MRAVLALVLVVNLWPSDAHAQDPYGCIDRLSDVEVRVRNEWLQERFDLSKKRARWWWYGQITLWTGIAVAQTVLAATADEVPDRFPNTVGAVGAWLTWLQLLVVPHTPAYAPQRFRRAPAATPEERRARLRYGLELLQEGAERQALIGGPGAHVVPVVWSAFWGSYISARFEDAWTSVRLIGGGVLVTEFRILSTPQQAVKDWEAARGMICGSEYVAPHDPLSGGLDGADEEPVEEEWDDGLGELDAEGAHEPDGGANGAEGETGANGETGPNPADEPSPTDGSPEARLFPTVGGLHLVVTF